MDLLNAINIFDIKKSPSYMFYMVLSTSLRINLLQPLDVTVITAQHLFLENAYLLYQLNSGLVSLIHYFNDLFTAPIYYFGRTIYCFGKDLFVAFIFIEKIFVPCLHLFVWSHQWKHQNNVWKLFKVNTEDTGMTSFWCLYC